MTVRLAAIACAALLLGAALAAPAAARAPRAFVGMNVDGPALEAGSDIPGELRRIRRAGATSVRWTLYWPALQPYRSWEEVPAEQRAAFVDAGGIPTDFRATDTFVAAAARAGLEPLPVVMASAPWAAERPERAFSPPVDMAAFGRFVGTLADRYGRGGTFWRAQPRLRHRPVRAWQIWNEAAGAEGFHTRTVFWNSAGDKLKGYVAMLTAARQALRSADPRARLMLGGLFGKSWIALRQLYAAGARNRFDIVAVHPYTRRARNVVRIARLARAVMARHGDRRKPLAVTELSWPSSAGWVRRRYTFTLTRRGQAAALARGFRLLAQERRRLRLRGVYWYTWMTRDRSSTDSFDHAGLLARRPDGRVRRKPAFYAFRRAARQLNRMPR